MLSPAVSQPLVTGYTPRRDLYQQGSEIRMTWQGRPLEEGEHYQVVVARRESAAGEWRRVLEQDVGKATSYTYRIPEAGAYSLNVVVLRGSEQVAAQWVGQITATPQLRTPWVSISLLALLLAALGALCVRTIRRQWAAGWRPGRWLAQGAAWVRGHVLFVAILLPAVAVRVALVSSMRSELTGDAQDYWGNAVQVSYVLRHLIRGEFLAAARCYPYPYYPIGFSLLLAPVAALWGQHWGILHAANVAWDSITIALVFLIGQRLLGRRAGYVAMALVAFYPGLVNMDFMLFPEQPFTALVLSALWMLVRQPFEQQRRRALLAGGGLLGIAAVIRPFALPLPALVLAYAIIRAWQQKVPLRRAVRAWALFTAGAVLAVLPVTGVNLAATGELIPVSNNAGVTLWHGNNPKATGTYNPALETDNPFGGLSYAERNRLAIGLAKEFILRHNDRFLALAPLKIRYAYWDDYNLVSSWPFRSTGGRDRWVYAIWLGPLPRVYHRALVVAWVLGLAWLLGSAVRRRRQAEEWLLVLIVVYWTAMAVVVFGHPKYGVPLVPLMCVFAALPLGRGQSPHTALRVEGAEGEPTGRPRPSREVLHDPHRVACL